VALARILIGIEMRFKPRAASLSQAPAESPNRAWQSRWDKLPACRAPSPDLFELPLASTSWQPVGPLNCLPRIWSLLRRRTWQESIGVVRQLCNQDHLHPGATYQFNRWVQQVLWGYEQANPRQRHVGIKRLFAVDHQAYQGFAL